MQKEGAKRFAGDFNQFQLVQHSYVAQIQHIIFQHRSKCLNFQNLPKSSFSFEQISL